MGRVRRRRCARGRSRRTPSPSPMTRHGPGSSCRAVWISTGGVLRPGCVYGGRQSLFAPWFAAAAKNEPVAVLGEGDNRRFSSWEPHNYLAKYKVPDDRVRQQLFPDRGLWGSGRFKEFIERRSALLADAMNDYIRRLERGELRE